MILSNFLSRQTHDNYNPCDIIPISYNMHRALCENYYSNETKKVFGTNSVTDEIKWNNITRGTQCKESVRYKHITRKPKDTIKK